MKTEGQENYVPALGFDFLTPFYDTVVKWTTREKVFKGKLVEQIETPPPVTAGEFSTSPAGRRPADSRHRPPQSRRRRRGDKFYRRAFDRAALPGRLFRWRGDEFVLSPLDATGQTKNVARNSARAKAWRRFARRRLGEALKLVDENRLAAGHPARRRDGERQFRRETARNLGERRIYGDNRNREFRHAVRHDSPPRSAQTVFLIAAARAAPGGIWHFVHRNLIRDED